MNMEHCPNTIYTSPGLLVAKIHVIFYVYHHNLFFLNFPLNLKGLVNIHKAKKSNDSYFVVQDGLVFP